MEDEGFYLDETDTEGLEAWLRGREFLEGEESIQSMASAGEGNMNLVLRVKTDKRSFIVKQARPFVEKYPDIPAPPDRNEVEALFYTFVQDDVMVAAAMPQLLDADDKDFVLILEDVGEGKDYMALGGLPPQSEETSDLLQWLSRLHAMDVEEYDERFENLRMRALNHEHIYELPLGDEELLDLNAITPQLSDVAAELKQDRGYVSAVRSLGDRYMSEGPSLLHGDFYPGSWLKTKDGVRVIDPEFCAVGRPEYDVGMVLAHVVLAGHRGADGLRAIEEHYKGPHGFRPDLVAGFAGAEIMRRLLGVAQLPINASLQVKVEWLKLSKQLVLRYAGKL